MLLLLELLLLELLLAVEALETRDATSIKFFFFSSSSSCALIFFLPTEAADTKPAMFPSMSSLEICPSLAMIRERMRWTGADAGAPR